MHRYHYYKSIINTNFYRQLGGASASAGGGGGVGAASAGGGSGVGSGVGSAEVGGSAETSLKSTTLEVSESTTEGEILALVREFIIHRSSRSTPDMLDLKKVIYILRGIPGVGKSTWSRRKLIEKGLQNNPKEHIFANDNFISFYRRDGDWVPYKSATNEEILRSESKVNFKSMRRLDKVLNTQSAVYLAMKKAEAIDTNLIIIDNTNSYDWELKIWVLLAMIFDYDAIVVEFDYRHLRLEEIYEKLSARPREIPLLKNLKEHDSTFALSLSISDQYLESELEKTAIEEEYLERILNSEPKFTACIFDGLLESTFKYNVTDVITRIKNEDIVPTIV